MCQLLYYGISCLLGLLGSVSSDVFGCFFCCLCIVTVFYVISLYRVFSCDICDGYTYITVATWSGLFNLLHFPSKSADTNITINVPLFKKLRDIIFFLRDNHFMSHFKGHFEGAKTFLTP